MHEIIRARYGTSDSHFTDVTGIIKKIVGKGCDSFYLRNSVFGCDPHPKVEKVLFVEWNDGFGQSYKENSNICIRHVWGNVEKKELSSQPISKRSLVYHVAPLIAGGDIWRWNIKMLKELGDSELNGRRVVSIVTGSEMESVESVLDEFGDFRIDDLIISQNTALGEGETLPTALRKVYSLSPEECFYYAHTKGVSWQGKNKEFAVMEWTECMYRCLFGNGRLVGEKLMKYLVVGAFKAYGVSDIRDFRHPRHNSSYNWFYPGSFFACRSDSLFRNNFWDRNEGDRHWIERYPPFFFKNEEAGVILESLNVKYNEISDLFGRFYSQRDWRDIDWRSQLKCLGGSFGL